MGAEREDALRDAWRAVHEEARTCKEFGDDKGYYACNRALCNIEDLYEHNAKHTERAHG